MAEAYIRVGDGTDQVTVFLHWTVGTGKLEDLRAADVLVFPEDAEPIPLLEGLSGICVRVDDAVDVRGCLFCARPRMWTVSFSPGPGPRSRSGLPDGRELKGGTLIPNDIQLIQPAAPRFLRPSTGPPCRVQLESVSRGMGLLMPKQRSRGSGRPWLPRASKWKKILSHFWGWPSPRPTPPSLSPGSLGFSTGSSLQQEVAVALQQGLPEGSYAVVAVAALDRNYVNWVRGGTFNPSGAVRISSLRGDGIGVLASAVRRSIQVVGIVGPGIPSCFNDP